jgi:hypothetical protein
MAGKKGKEKNKRYGTIKDKGNGKYLVTFDFGVIDGKRFRQSRQYNDPDEADDALREQYASCFTIKFIKKFLDM